jgi:hypothetical protein
MPAPTIIGLDERILETIDALRVKHHACTARLVARTLKLDASYIAGRIRLLHAQGHVQFDANVPGAIWVTGTVECREVDGVLTPVSAAKQLPGDATPAPAIKLGVDPARAAAAAAKRAAKRAATAASTSAAPKKRGRPKKATAPTPPTE